ncbi:MAG: DUF3822 family protein [Bacteroidales bacterium]|nr:DUF3822 family protein [Bacteroidales bacterium]
MECILNQVDPQYDTTQGFNYRLSVLLCEDGFSFLITHTVTQKVLKIASYTFIHTGIQKDEMGGWPINGNDYFEKLKKVDLTQLTYQQVDIAVASQKITVAPHDFLDHDNVLNIISSAYTVAPGEEILTEAILNSGPATAILIPGYIQEFCDLIFPGTFLRCAAAVFVKGILRNQSQIFARQVFINIHPGFFEITVIQGQRLLYLNAFKYSAPSDVLYYVVFVLEQLGFVPSEEKITLMGDITYSSVIYTQLEMYCESLKFVEKPDVLQYGATFTGIALHHYFVLLNLPICE